MRFSPLGVIGLLLLLDACAVGPNYEKPTVQPPAHWSETDVGPTGPQTNLARWWQGFDDPILNSLIDRAIAGNLDLQTAVARIREARASRVAASSPLWPTLTGSGSATRFHGSANSLGVGGLLGGPGAAPAKAAPMLFP
jgi:outer membrane protein TolC